MSIRGVYRAQPNEHWAADELGDDGDLIVFFAPPVPSYAAPPPPGPAPTSPRKPSEIGTASMPVRSVATIYEKQAPSIDAPKVSPQKLVPKGPAPPIPTGGRPGMPSNGSRVSNGVAANGNGAGVGPAPVPPKRNRPRSGSFPDGATHEAGNGSSTNHNVGKATGVPRTANSTSVGLTRPVPPELAKSSAAGSAASAKGLRSGLGHTLPTLPPTPLHPAPSTPTSSGQSSYVPHTRAASTSATVASLPQFDHRKASLPPLPNAPLPPTRASAKSSSASSSSYSANTSSDVLGSVNHLPIGSRPALLIPVLPTNGGNFTRDSSTSHSAPSSTNPSPRAMSYGTLPPNFSPTGGAPKVALPSMPSSISPSNLGRAHSDSKTDLPSISPGTNTTGSITSLSTRPSLRVDESISDNRVIQEIVITHDDYVKDLHTIQTIFAGPMKDRQIVSPEVHVIFFDGIGELIRVEEILLGDLMATKKMQPVDVANIFIKHVKNMQVYIPFCARQDQTLKLMSEQLATNPSFATFCEEVRKEANCRGLSFDAFIIKPLQRLCKLPLLFRELLKGLPGASSDGGLVPPQSPAQMDEKRKLESAQSSLEAILDEINKSTGNAEKLIELERNLSKKYPQVETLNLQHRKLLLEGEIAWVVKQSKDQAKLRLGRFWLLDQLLLFCRSPKELDFIMPLNTVSISKHLPAVQNFPYVLELSDMTAQGIVTRKLCCSDRDLYDNLITNLS